MTELRKAAEMALEALEIGYDSAQAEAHQFHAAMAGYKPQRHAAMDADVQKIAAAITALRQAIAEQPAQQEPVAWLHNFIKGNVIAHKPADIDRHSDRWTALYKDPTPCKTCQSLAMAVMNDQIYHEEVIAKREWVGLADEEIMDRWPCETRIEFARWIEAKLKEKNT